MQFRYPIKMLSFVSFFLVIAIVTFQNCAMNKGSFETLSEGKKDLGSLDSALPLDQSHPSQKDVNAPTQKHLVVNRDYVENLFRELFSLADGSPSPAVEDLLHKWVIPRGAQFGLGCDPNSSYTGRDCGGDLSGANFRQQTDHNTIRESFLIQLCEGALGTDEGLQLLLAKTEDPLLSTKEPTYLDMQKVFYLFYRSYENSKEILTPLLDFDAALKANKEPLLERWRGISLEICESQGWQKI